MYIETLKYRMKIRVFQSAAVPATFVYTVLYYVLVTA